MSKETTKSRIQTEITLATSTNSITPVIVGSIIDEVVELVALPIPGPQGPQGPQGPTTNVRPYKVYTCLFTANGGTGNPIVMPLESTFNLAITWQRIGTGDFIANFNESLVMDKTTIQVENPFDATTRFVGSRISEYQCRFNSFNVNTGVPVNSSAIECLIEVRVYN